ncbi:MAG: hypothetical protein JO368_07945 [Acidimicrobiales bacterium]|nr:hypothetical protein [Acidimicrobiales bacterium]
MKLHVVILVVVPAFMALCVWQIGRALGGNSLSWAYVFEWPIFAAYAVYMWWRFVHEAPDDAVPAGADGPQVPAAAEEHQPGEPDEDRQDAELAAYNDYLARLAERDRATGR